MKSSNAGPDEWWRVAENEARIARGLHATGDLQQCYHHAGQALEFALKAIYMLRNQHRALPDECRGARWHSLEFIASKAGISGELGDLRSSRQRYAYWLTVRDWDSNRRFPDAKKVSKIECRDFMIAAFSPTGGIFQWLEIIYQKN